MADSLNQSYDMVLLPKTPKHQTFEESWDGILASSFTTLLICMPMLDHWCIFLVASPAISEILKFPSPSRPQTDAQSTATIPSPSRLQRLFLLDNSQRQKPNCCVILTPPVLGDEGDEE
jgi:hypothetical protein